jgi:hypothetical protein
MEISRDSKLFQVLRASEVYNYAWIHTSAWFIANAPQHIIFFENWPEKIEINTEKNNIYSKYKTDTTGSHRSFFSKRIFRIISEQKREQEARALRHVDNRENCSSWQELQDWQKKLIPPDLIFPSTRKLLRKETDTKQDK